MSETLEAKFGLPKEVIFGKRCVMSNQRPSSSVELRHTRDLNHSMLHIDEKRVCGACRFVEIKDQIVWYQQPSRWPSPDRSRSMEVAPGRQGERHARSLKA